MTKNNDSAINSIRIDGMEKQLDRIQIDLKEEGVKIRNMIRELSKRFEDSNKKSLDESKEQSEMKYRVDTMWVYFTRGLYILIGAGLVALVGERVLTYL